LVELPRLAFAILGAVHDGKNHGFTASLKYLVDDDVRIFEKLAGVFDEPRTAHVGEFVSFERVDAVTN
jgi:hypothetical protein